MGQTKIAQDAYRNNMQFGHVEMASLTQITTAEVWNADYDKHVRITPEGGSAFVYIGDSATTPADGTTGFALAGTEYFIVRAGEYIGASAAISCIQLGEN